MPSRRVTARRVSRRINRSSDNRASISRGTGLSVAFDSIPLLSQILEDHPTPNFGFPVEQAKAGLADGGIPIGSVLVIDGRIAGQGYNKRVQQHSPVLHAEMDCLQNAGRLPAPEYRRATLYSTLSPCDMCSGAILLYKIPRAIVGENRTFRGP